MNYVFYDFETSGLNFYFDQPIQLAAKLVNDNFEIIDEINEKCKLRDGVIPSPIAMLVTKTDLYELNKEQSFYEMMDKVYKKFTDWSPAIFIGYNNINFDEKFLRSSFYQSLHAPYLTNTNNNSRVDLYKIILSICNLEKSYLKLPINPETGKKSLKLEIIAENNSIKHDFAHDAMSDVDATIGLADLIKKNDSTLWEYLMSFRNHTNVTDFMSSNDIFILPPTNSSGSYIPVTYLTSNPDNIKEVILYNLEEEVIDDITNARTRQISGLFKGKILKKIKSNDYPILLKEDQLTGGYKEEYLKNKKIYEKRKKDIQSNTNLVMNINQYLVDQLADYQVDSRDYTSASDHVDELLYSGFTGPSDWKKVEKLAKENDFNSISRILNEFEDTRLPELYKRKLYSDKKELLPVNLVEQQAEYISNKIFNDDLKVPWNTLQKAKQELQKAKDDKRFSNMSADIDNIRAYLSDIESNYK